ncbi:MAG: serine/threonine protein kinase [Verrucomicrobiales bacterium]|jgi:serine/threonine protein kinase|nr:serine/threonine protein kinase [Verrucomicrobiales bacterium]
MTRTDMLANRYAPTGKRFNGGQGIVIEAVDTFLDRIVAIKFYKTNGSSKDLKEELSKLKRIRSNHVVNLFDIISMPKEMALVQEYLKGKNLNGYLKGEANQEQILKTLYQVASGLNDIHKAGLIHRDIKPSNMKFDEMGIIKIFDFGISSIQENTYTTGGWGTLGYLGPEFYQQHPSIPISTKTDVYAFGVSVWSILIEEQNLPIEFKQRPPFHIDPAPSIKKITSFLPKQLISLIDSCLAPSPEARPSMEEIRDQLQAELLKDKHIARVTIEREQHIINKRTPKATISVAERVIEITYNGYDFSVSAITGDVKANGEPLKLGSKLAHSCILDFGSLNFIPFDQSHPEILL